MKTTYSWLKSFVPDVVDPHTLAEDLTTAGVAVDAVLPLNQGLSGARSGLITEVGPHPNADKLLVCQLNMGDTTLQIATGAQNVSVGQIVPVAVPGTVLPGGKLIETVDFRGVKSEGMLLSPDEMGIDKKTVHVDMRDGILILPHKTPLGADVVELLGLDDYLLELDLTPNRADCLSVAGIAQDIAAIYDLELKNPPMRPLQKQTNTSSQFALTIKDEDLCPGYLGLIIDNVKIGESPLWLQSRLRNVGIRPINNLVDLTNFVMMELGQPLHAFDYDKLQGEQIVVRRSQPGESIVTLDGETRILPPETLVIADEVNPVAIAGIMGGLESEVGAQTQRVVIESAWFDLVSIRKTSKALGLRSDASARFDKGIDPAGVYVALTRLAHLVEELGIGTVREPLVGMEPQFEPERVVVARSQRINSLLGLKLTPDQMAALLRRLGFGVEVEDAQLMVTVPSRRRDVLAEVDLVEEVGRIYGMDNIPTLDMQGKLTQGRLTPSQSLLRQMRHKLVGLGLNEVFTLSFHDPYLCDNMGLNEIGEASHQIPILNPLSRERSALRSSLVPGLLGVLEHNFSRQVQGMACFELSRVFIADDLPLITQPQEPLHLSFGCFGELPGNWVSPSIKADFYYIKGLVEAVLPGSEYLRSSEQYLHPGRQAHIYVRGKKAGFVGQIHPKLAHELGFKQEVYVAELNFNVAFGSTPQTARFDGVPRSLPLERDLAFVVDGEVTAAQLVGVMQSAGGQELISIEVFDVFSGGSLPVGKKSLAFRLTFVPQDATPDFDPSSRINDIAAKVETELKATLRR